MMFQNFCFSLLVSLSAFVFVNRIVRIFRGKIHFSENILTKIGTFYSMFSFCILFFWNQFPFFIFTLHLLLQTSAPFFFWAYKKKLQTGFCKEFLRFSSLLLIKMKMGDAFRTAYEDCLAHSHWKQGVLLRQLLDDVVFSPQKTRKRAGSFENFLFQCEDVFLKMDHNPSCAIDQLFTFRKQLLQREKIRRRSGQIWSQVLVQFGIIATIYFGFLIYTLSEYGFQRHKSAVLLSLSCFIMGVIVLLHLRKVPQWKL